MFLKSSVSLKQEIKCSRIIDFIRILYTVDSNLQDTFKEVGIRHKIYGITPWLIGKNIHRGDEINEYIVNNGNVEKYCILDDIDDFHENQKPFFIKCKAYEDGLNLETANKAIEILNS